MVSFSSNSPTIDGGLGGLVRFLKSSRGLVPSVLLLCHPPGVVLDHVICSGSLADVHLTDLGRDQREGSRLELHHHCYLHFIGWVGSHDHT